VGAAKRLAGADPLRCSLSPKTPSQQEQPLPVRMEGLLVVRAIPKVPPQVWSVHCL